jgi:hypothetical protein
MRLAAGIMAMEMTVMPVAGIAVFFSASAVLAHGFLLRENAESIEKRQESQLM